MRIFAGVPMVVAPNDSGVVETGQRFLIFLLPFKMTPPWPQTATRGGANRHI